MGAMPPLRDKLDTPTELLSKREAEVYALAEGCTNREIGERLYISENTARNHVSIFSGAEPSRSGMVRLLAVLLVAKVASCLK